MHKRAGTGIIFFESRVLLVVQIRGQTVCLIGCGYALNARVLTRFGEKNLRNGESFAFRFYARRTGKKQSIMDGASQSECSLTRLKPLPVMLSR